MGTTINAISYCTTLLKPKATINLIGMAYCPKMCSCCMIVAILLWLLQVKICYSDFSGKYSDISLIAMISRFVTIMFLIHSRKLLKNDYSLTIMRSGLALKNDSTANTRNSSPVVFILSWTTNMFASTFKTTMCSHYVTYVSFFILYTYHFNTV